IGANLLVARSHFRCKPVGALPSACPFSVGEVTAVAPLPVGRSFGPQALVFTASDGYTTCNFTGVVPFKFDNKTPGVVGDPQVPIPGAAVGHPQGGYTCTGSRPGSGTFGLQPR